MELHAPAARVLGCLVEKALATPAQYPLSLNALRAACNQSTNREPVVDFDERTVHDGLAELREMGLARSVGTPGSRTMRYAHLLDETFDIGSDQLALLALLLLRGPQTVGELRTRAERLHRFEAISETHDALARLSTHVFGPLVAEVPRRPGQKEVRFATTLAATAGGGDPASQADDDAATSGPDTAGPPVVPGLGDLHDAEVTELRNEVEELRQALADLTERVTRLE